MSVPEPDNEDPEADFDDSFSSYEEQEEFIQRVDKEHSLSKRIEDDAESRWLAGMDVIDESDFILPSAASYGLYANWELHPDGRHVYGYRLEGFGGFKSNESTPAGNGVYLSMRPFDTAGSDRAPARHAFLPPRRSLLVVNESVYFESDPALVFQDIRQDDSLWLKLCKVAAHRSHRLYRDKWSAPLFGDMLTTLLCEAGYDSIYFQSFSKPWVVLLMPGRPLVAQRPMQNERPPHSSQTDPIPAQPIHVEIEVSFESRKTIEIELPFTSRQDALWSRRILEEEDPPEWPGGCESEIDREIRLETVVLKLFFMQDFLDGNAAPFAELECRPDVSKRGQLAKTHQGAFGIERCGFRANKQVSSDIELMPSITIDSDFLTIGPLKIGPWDFEDAEWDESYDLQWIWEDEWLPFHPSFICDPPRGLEFGEWQKLIGEADYIRLHTTHPQAACHTKVAALVSPDNEIFIEWLLMLPDEHLRNLGLLATAHEWIEREKKLRRIFDGCLPSRWPRRLKP